MTARKRPVVTVDVKRWSAEVTGPVRFVIPACRAALGQLWSLEHDNRRRCVRIPASRAADVVAALETVRGISVVVKGNYPHPELFT